MLKVLSSILCDLDPKVKVIGKKAGICDGVPSTSALVYLMKYASIALVSHFVIIYLTFNALMECSIWFDTINLGWSIVYIEGLHVIISKNCFFFFL